SNKLFFISNINRNYAPPTFNDLYWPTFGNPDLIPETSVKFDVGVHYVTSFVSLKTSYFNSFVEDGIIWWVDSTGAYRPSNVNQISTDGITIEALHSSIINDLSLDFSIGYTHLKSTYDSRDGSDAVVGNTVVYTPSNKINASLNVDYKSSGLLVDYQYTDKRFTYDSNT